MICPPCAEQVLPAPFSFLRLGVLVERLGAPGGGVLTAAAYFERRNIHFYVNRCGFRIAAFFRAVHREPNESV